MEQFLFNPLTVIGLLILALTLVRELFRLGFDDTDDKTKRQRSGFILKVDKGTGCHYLQSWSGSITPRLNPDGTPMCRPEDKRKED